MNEIKIRYNNSCSDGINYWRALIDGKEQVFSDIEVNVKSTTSKDWMEDLNCYKFHILCHGVIKIVNKGNSNVLIIDNE